MDATNHSSPLRIAVFIDALGWRIAQEHGFLQDLLRCRTPVETVLGYSATCIPTILTGVPPREHGHFTFFRYEPERPSFPRWTAWLRHLPRRLADRGRARSYLSRGLQRILRWDGYTQLYEMPFALLPRLEYTERRDLYRPGGIRGGQPTIFDELTQAGVAFHVSDWRRSESENLATLEARIPDPELRFAYLYLADLDGLLHAEGTRSSAVARKIAWYERALGTVLSRARDTRGSVELMVFSDHGMSDVTEQCDLMARLRRSGLREGVDYIGLYDGTLARFWILREAIRERLLDCLAEEPLGRVLDEAELARLGCDFPDRDYGEIFFLLAPGVLMCPSHMGSRPVAAMHGYHPSDPDATAFFGSTTTGVTPPGSLLDLRCTLLDGVVPMLREAA